MSDSLKSAEGSVSKFWQDHATIVAGGSLVCDYQLIM